MASMKGPMRESILHDGKGESTAGRAEAAERTQRKKSRSLRFPGALGVLGGEMFSGCALALRELGRTLLHSLGAALADQKQADSLQQIGGGVHSAGEKNVSLRFAIVDANLARDEDGRCVGRQIFYGGNQLRA